MHRIWRKSFNDPANLAGAGERKAYLRISWQGSVAKAIRTNNFNVDSEAGEMTHRCLKCSNDTVDLREPGVGYDQELLDLGRFSRWKACRIRSGRDCLLQAVAVFQSSVLARLMLACESGVAFS